MMGDAQGAARDYLATPPDGPSDARDWLKAQLSRGVERAPGSVQVFLEALHWRQRAVIVLLYAERMSQQRISWLLGVTPRTIQRDIADVFTLLGGLHEFHNSEEEDCHVKR
jgi:DNA-directed RNA polymerase specialized sigma24 family protein